MWFYFRRSVTTILASDFRNRLDHLIRSLVHRQINSPRARPLGPQQPLARAQLTPLTIPSPPPPPPPPQPAWQNSPWPRRTQPRSRVLVSFTGDLHDVMYPDNFSHMVILLEKLLHLWMWLKFCNSCPSMATVFMRSYLGRLHNCSPTSEQSRTWQMILKESIVMWILVTEYIHISLLTEVFDNRSGKLVTIPWGKM